jgi:hypothetical protein
VGASQFSPTLGSRTLPDQLGWKKKLLGSEEMPATKMFCNIEINISQDHGATAARVIIVAA